jgi:hypothetical protein
MATQSMASNKQSQAAESRSRRDAEEALQPLQDVMEYLRNYAREQPEMAAMWCFGIGFVLGWKLKPW